MDTKGHSQTFLTEAQKAGNKDPSRSRNALFAQGRESVQHSGSKGDGIAQQRGQGQAGDDGDDSHPGGEAEVKGHAHPAATTPLPVLPGSPPPPSQTIRYRKDPGKPAGTEIHSQPS